jgi:hypothetical protein
MKISILLHAHTIIINHDVHNSAMTSNDMSTRLRLMVGIVRRDRMNQ